MMKIDQSPSHQEQDACHRGSRQIRSQWCDQEKDQQQEDRCIHRRHRCARACCVVHAAAIERTAGGVTGEEATDQIRHALPDEFLIAIDALFRLHRNGTRDRHCLGQRQHSDHQGREHHLVQRRVGKIRYDERRQVRRECSHRLDHRRLDTDFQIDHIGHHTPHHHRHDHIGQLGNEPLGQNAHRQRDHPDKRDIKIDVAELRDGLFDHYMERCTTRDIDTEEVLHLASRDQQGGARCETDDHGMRDEVDQHSHACQPQDQLEHAHQKGQRQHHADEFRRAGIGQRTHGGEYGDGDSSSRPRDQMPTRPEQRGDDCRQHSRIQAVFRRHAGDGGKCDPLR